MSPHPTRNDQAAQLMGEIVDAILSGSFDLVDVTRKAFHACGLAGWSAAQALYRRELEGYPDDSELPSYRRGLSGTKKWAPASLYDAPNFIAQRRVYGEAELPESTSLEFRGPLANVVKWSQTGLSHRTAETRVRKEGRESWSEVKIVEYAASGFQRIARSVEQFTFQSASAAYTTLTYGDALEDIWEGYRTRVEPVLSELGLENHFELIRDGLAATNPENWRTAMFGCRNVLVDLASYLWRDPKETYAPLAQDGEPFRVDESRYINRLAAYLHFKGVTGHSGKYLRSELERINSSIHALNELDSKGHAPVTREDARLAAMGTYVLLGEFVERTDMKPIEDASESGGS